MRREIIATILFVVALLFAACRHQTDSNQEMVELLQYQDRFENNAANMYAPAAVLQQQDSIIEHTAPGIVLLQVYMDKATTLLQLGQEQKAVAILDSLNHTFIPDYLQREALIKGLAIACMRLGERYNCINNHAAEACIFPIRGKGIHTDKNGSERAIALYQQLLKNNSDDYESLWLLNIAYMTVGGYPQQVPPRYLLKIGDTIVHTSVKPFTDVAMNLGLAIRKMGGGSIVDDFNHDGYDDIITSSSNLKEPLHYFVNNKNGTFTDIAQKAGLSQFTGGLNIMQTDYNNDGLKDIFVLRGAWKGKFGKEPNSLLRNNGDGTFTDVTKQSGLLSFHPTQTATWADFNNDGWLDVFIGNESTASDVNACELFINNKNGTFTESALSAGAAVKLFVKGVTSGDYDNDGRTDIFISTMNGDNILLKNITQKNGPVKFKDVTREAQLDTRNYGTFTTWFWDYDNDGFQDLLICGYGNNIPIARIAGAEALHRYQGSNGKLILYRNLHNGTFKDVSQQVQLNNVSFAMGANFGDIDNDGFLDFYLGTGNPLFSSLIPNKLFKNEAGQKFTDITIPARVGSLQKGHGVAFADLNNDGNEDIFINQGGAYPGDAYQNALFINPGQNNDNHWVNILLEGTTSNKLAIGARLKLTFTDNGIRRSVYRIVNSGGSFGSNPLLQHIGIGKALQIDTLTITWPVTGKTQYFNNIKKGNNIKIKEGVDKLTPYQLIRLDFDKPAVAICNTANN
ncbi:CRTAC1 family protein [Mucilaginibacter paludis]|uniref:FG-GAP repeat protein n=1 Tax=Mucilaginibacter paludis DSM 18603 TaxID=714943 RepID=H1Y296_9SPHI|nr:CRTAC1 family protein [Mucilaginibacter paludis]EHQ27876.1 FG-GAP repeat protein [Mucilaginibacter paludis DSM 18603]